MFSGNQPANQRGLIEARQHRLRGGDQISGHILGLVERDALHGIDDMTVETGKEPEAVFTGKILPLLDA